jgi:hypothetical protein
MNKRLICLLISALGMLSAMLIVSAALTNQSALAQTPTPVPDCISDTLPLTFDPASLDTPPYGDMVYNPPIPCLCMMGLYTMTTDGSFSYGTGNDACYMWGGATSTISDAVSNQYQLNPFNNDPGCGDGGTSGPWNFGGWANRDLSVITLPFALNAITMTWRGEPIYPFHVSNSGGILSGCFLTPTICGCSGIEVAACGVVQDYHFVSPVSWVGDGVTWSAHQWASTPLRGVFPGYGTLQQSVSVSMTGNYSVVISAKSNLGTVVRISDNGTEAGSPIQIPSGTNNFTTFATSIQLAAGSRTLMLIMDDGGVATSVIDSVCVTPGITASSYGPCGITSADMISSKYYLKDPGFDDGITFVKVWVSGFGSGFPLGIYAGLNTDTSYTLINGDWTSGAISSILLDWFPTFHGMLRYRDGANNRALGIVPVPLYTKISALRLPTGPFNFVYRMNRKFSNARLFVNGNDQCSDTGYGSWIQNSIYFPSSDSLILSTDCGGVECLAPFQDAKLGAVDIDDAYIIPGPAIPNCVCVGGTLTPPVPVITGTCINANPQFLDTSSWRTVGGASILTGGTGGWARIPGGSFIEQDIPVATAGTTWGNLQTSLVVGMTYVIQTAAHIESATEASQYSVIMGASSPGQITANHQIVPPEQYSSVNADSMMISANMAGDGDNPTARLRIANEAGGTVLMDTVCVQSTGVITGPPIPPPPTGPCLGTWTSSGGGTALGVTIPGLDYVQNAQQSMYGSYVLDVSGEQGQDYNTLRVRYQGAVNYDNIGLFDVVGYSFDGQTSFVVPPGGYYNGALQIMNYDALEYTNICLRQAAGPPPNPPTNPPGTLPIPECGSVNAPFTNTTGFYQLAPYAISEEYSGTAPVILAGLSYNYAIYPLVCTTISIANWQYNAYTAWIDKFNIFASRLSSQLAQIIALLEAILAAIPDMIIPPTCGILDVMLWLLKVFLDLFVKFMILFAQSIQLVIDIFKEMMLDVRGEAAVQYPFSCSGDGYWLCFALAGILSVQNQVGDWFNIIALIVCSMLTVSLVFWTINQIRGMAQPGTEEGPSE